MKASEILLFGGTVEGRKLCEKMTAMGLYLYVSVATEYGEEMLPEQGAHLLCGRMNEEEIFNFLQDHSIRLVIDATHPYAVEVTKNIQAACRKAGKEYIRVLRENTEESFINSKSLIYVQSCEQATSFLRNTQGNILLTTGAKELKKFAECLDVQRLFVRILPSQESLAQCISLQIPMSHIICMQGPFSEEMNVALIHQYQIQILVTKESGKAGGYPEKLRAAEQASVQTVVIGRPPQVPGFSYEDVCNRLEALL